MPAAGMFYERLRPEAPPAAGHETVAL